MSLVRDIDSGLPDEGQAPQSELDTQSLLINGLQQSGAQQAMHFNSGPNHFMGQPVQLQPRLTPRSSLLCLGALGAWRLGGQLLLIQP
jgi:hypothetical protein